MSTSAVTSSTMRGNMLHKATIATNTSFIDSLLASRSCIRGTWKNEETEHKLTRPPLQRGRSGICRIGNNGQILDLLPPCPKKHVDIRLPSFGGGRWDARQTNLVAEVPLSPFSYYSFVGAASLASNSFGKITTASPIANPLFKERCRGKICRHKDGRSERANQSNSVFLYAQWMAPQRTGNARRH